MTHDATADWRHYLELCKPKVVALMLLSAVVGMLLAPQFHWDNWVRMLIALIGIAGAAGAGAAVNHVIDQRFDKLMARTHKRPVPQGHVPAHKALIFAGLLGAVSMGMLLYFINTLTALLSLGAMLGYALIYTRFLKHATPQNIVIGGLSGALPPLLGWTAIANQINAEPLLLVLIIFVWTPPHFWALAIYRHEDYCRANIPMLPITHGIDFTKHCILLYTILLVVVSYLPVLITMSGLLYGIGISLLNARFVYWTITLWRSTELRRSLQTFRFSITYLMVLFILILADHAWRIPI